MTDAPNTGPPRVQPAERPQILPSTGWAAILTTLVAGAMSFLAVLTLAAAMSANRLADEWRADLAGVATVRVSAIGTEDMGERIATTLEVLRTTPGIAEVQVLSDTEQAALLAPWLGASATLADLPAPRLINVTLDGRGPDADALQARMDLTLSGVLYDDHAAWRAPLAAAARGLQRLAIGATVLVLLTGGIMVAFAARATLAANVHVIATVRLMGAEERFIASAFVNGLTRRAGLGGLGGAVLAAGALLALPSIEVDQGLSAALSPDPLGWALLALGIPIAGALVAWFAARTAVRVALAQLP